MTGTQCGRFRLGREIGAGGMGRVYSAQDLLTGETVAVKIGDRRVLSDHIARTVELVRDPNVVRVLGYGRTHDGASYVAMELVAGTPLGQHVRAHGALSFPRIVRLGTQLLAGLHALHGKRLVHGDVKSDNLLVDEADHAVLIDLGFGPCGREHTFTGTPEYVAPEVISGSPPSEASDLYGVGIMIYEMVTATTPFAGGSADEIFERHLVETPAPMSVRCPGRSIPPELELLVGRALDKEPAARPESARDFARELRRALPASHEDDAVPDCACFSTSGPTLDWTRPTFSETVSSLVR